MTKRKPGGFCHSDSLDGTIGKAIGLHDQTFCEAICDEHEQGIIRGGFFSYNKCESFLISSSYVILLSHFLLLWDCC